MKAVMAIRNPIVFCNRTMCRADSIYARWVRKLIGQTRGLYTPGIRVRSYGWSYGEPEQFITILELPPVDSPESAVKVGVAYQIKKGKM